jgi:molecular chaperone GrpE
MIELSQSIEVIRMERKEKKKSQNQTGSMETEQENLLEDFSKELYLHLEEEKKEKEKEIEELKKKLEEKEKEVGEHHDRLLRVAADFDNYKKRAAREKEEWVKFANEDLIKSILPFVDNLERAVNHSEKTKDIQRLIEGIKMTVQQLLQALNKFGVSPIESLGKPFDPTLHEAMLVVETDQHEPNQVMEEFQKGYLLNDRLLRPATVSVSKYPEKEAQTRE